MEHCPEQKLHSLVIALLQILDSFFADSLSSVRSHMRHIY